MNENLYKLEIKMDEIHDKSENLKVLLITDKQNLKTYNKEYRRMFPDLSIENIYEEDLDIKLKNKLKDFDFIITGSFSQEKIITDIINITGNKKHIVLLNDKVEQFHILSMNKRGNVLFLGNNLESMENLKILEGYINIIRKQKKMQIEYAKVKPDTVDEKREQILIYTNTIVVKNILKKVFKDVKIKEKRYEIVEDSKNFYIELNKQKDVLKIVILTSEKPPFDEVKMINKISKDIKILYVSSTKDNTLIKELERIGVDDFIYKPFQMENLIEKIRIADDVEQKVEHKISLFSLKELIERFNTFTKTANIKEETTAEFKKYFKFLQV
jgi:DNA-binding response OmpR family regulator